MNRRFAFAFAFAVASAVLVGHTALMVRASLGHTGGTFTYPLDDAFIHMAMGRHIAFDGVYGVTRHEFAAASSSIVWPWLLALVDKIAGDHLLTPLLLNAAFGLAIVVALGRLFAREAPRATFVSALAWGLALVVLTPLPTLVIIGMEHTLHALLMFLFVAEAARVLAHEARVRSPWLFALAALAAATRYESMFAIGGAAMFALARQRRRDAVSLLASGLAPILAFGLYSRSHGGPFLPNSVLLKGRPGRLQSLTDLGDFFGGDFVNNTSVQPHLLALLLGVSVLLAWAIRRHGIWSAAALRLALALWVTVAHIQLAALGWFFRYEAYVVALDIAACALFAGEMLPNARALLAVVRSAPVYIAACALFVFASVGPLVRRGLEAARFTPAACRNIYEQQVQSARFLARHFATEPVALNDIGAVAYLGDQPIVDLIGLASTAVARAKKFDVLKALTPAQIADFTRETNVAVVYDEWFPGVLPATWTRLGTWRLDVCRSCAFPAVAIYATRPEAIPRVLGALRKFARELPASVHQTGRYAQLPVSDAPEEAYLLDEGDVVQVDAPFADDALERRYGTIAAIGTGGTFAYPYLAPVPAAGITVRDVEAHLRARFGEIARKDSAIRGEVPDVRVRLVRRRTLRFLVTGHARSSGEYWAADAPTAREALAWAGGATRRARSTEAPYVLRERDASGVFDTLEMSETLRLRSLDIMVVP